MKWFLVSLPAIFLVLWSIVQLINSFRRTKPEPSLFARCMAVHMSQATVIARRR